MDRGFWAAGKQVRDWCNPGFSENRDAYVTDRRPVCQDPNVTAFFGIPFALYHPHPQWRSCRHSGKTGLWIIKYEITEQIKTENAAANAGKWYQLLI